MIEKVSAVVLSVERLMHDRFFLGPRTTVNWLIAPLVMEAVIHVREYIPKNRLENVYVCTMLVTAAWFGVGGYPD